MVVNLLVEEQLILFEDFLVDEQLPVEGIVEDTVGGIVDMSNDIVKEFVFEDMNILSILVVDKIVTVDETNFAKA